MRGVRSSAMGWWSSSGRRAERMPAYVYGLTPGAERLFPRAYERVLDKLLDVLGERLPADVLESALREVGRRLAAQRNGSSTLDVRARIQLAAGTLEELCGLIETEEDEGTGTLRLRGFGCLLAAVAPDHLAPVAWPKPCSRRSSVRPFASSASAPPSVRAAYLARAFGRDCHAASGSIADPSGRPQAVYLGSSKLLLESAYTARDRYRAVPGTIVSELRLELCGVL
jgi:hypothetical protein